MIFVSRDSLDVNGKPIRPNGDWFTAAAKATVLAIKEGKSHVINEGIYRHSEVKKALEKLFHDKCAYCEWHATGGSDWDVEHFRPKGAVSERKDHPGYYWLPYEWSNLYLSCSHCNQYRKDPPRWHEPTELPATGKLDQFPLFDETTRVMSHVDNQPLDSERRLLVDPCHDDPAVVFGFNIKGEVMSIDDNPMGTETIRVFRLWRRRLSDLRQKKVRRVLKIHEAIHTCEARGNAEAAAEFRTLLNDELSDASEFAGVARFINRNPEVFNMVASLGN